MPHGPRWACTTTCHAPTLVDEVLAAAKHFQRATSDYVFPSPKTGGQMSGFTKMVNRLVKEAGVAKFTMHDAVGIAIENRSLIVSPLCSGCAALTMSP
jgi:hypothetical protein